MGTVLSTLKQQLIFHQLSSGAQMLASQSKEKKGGAWGETRVFWNILSLPIIEGYFHFGWVSLFLSFCYLILQGKVRSLQIRHRHKHNELNSIHLSNVRLNNKYSVSILYKVSVDVKQDNILPYISWCFSQEDSLRQKCTIIQVKLCILGFWTKLGDSFVFLIYFWKHFSCHLDNLSWQIEK